MSCITQRNDWQGHLSENSNVPLAEWNMVAPQQLRQLENSVLEFVVRSHAVFQSKPPNVCGLGNEDSNLEYREFQVN
jgi:hypothetical protein